MSRLDLLALTPEALASLANVGLVKRAQRELEGGAGPALDEAPDGTVSGTFENGIVARLPPSTTLAAAPCTCGATGICRHRVAVALAYKPWHERMRTNPSAPETSSALRADSTPGTESAPGAEPAPRIASAPRAEPEAGAGSAPASEPPWSPATLDDATLARVLGPRLLARARALLRRGLIATVERGAVPVAKLPSCTVRFLVPRDIAYARCDCAASGGGCEHLALAIWAFRAAPEEAPTAVVELGEPIGATAATATTAATDAIGSMGATGARAAVLDGAEALARDILAIGMVETAVPVARFSELRTLLAHEGMTWIHGIVADLEAALDGYHRRSALHGAGEVAALLVELMARIRAARTPKLDLSALPARFVLGEDEAPETRLDHLRLVSLGARIRADDRARFADVYLADPDAALVLVLRKRWDFDLAREPDEGPQLARQKVAPRITLDALARGDLVSKVVTRRANRSIELGSGRMAQSSVTPQRGEWDALPLPILVRSLDEHEARIAHRPPRILRPRVLAEEVHALQVTAVHDVTYMASEQKLIAELADGAGRRFHLVVQHRRAAPHAIEAAARALAHRVRFVAGDLARGPSGWQLDPLAIAGDELVVPDIAGPTPSPTVRSHTVREPLDPLDLAMTRAESVLEELCHAGLKAPSRSLLARLEATAEQLDDAGLVSLAMRFDALKKCARETPGVPAAPRWVDAAVRLAVTRAAQVSSIGER
ncbi:hypothetical protein [Pendulispora albinea]|uniref:SWIM-type domain-containing protein n=1 Tax=Pendulispora albinea TaxID=2741071 RepID=A0ABZ2M5U0_9BACT